MSYDGIRTDGKCGARIRRSRGTPSDWPDRYLRRELEATRKREPQVREKQGIAYVKFQS